MKLSEFLNNDKENLKEKTENKNESNKKTTEEEIGKLYDEMKDKSESELMNRLKEEIKNQKMRGEFDYEGILNTLQSFRAFISEEEYQRMIRIINEFK